MGIKVKTGVDKIEMGTDENGEPIFKEEEKFRNITSVAEMIQFRQQMGWNEEDSPQFTEDNILSVTVREHGTILIGTIENPKGINTTYDKLNIAEMKAINKFLQNLVWSKGFMARKA